MGEIKSVKVDNWGVFFLQKLQNFFNKTDYCDLTLQFKDNSQLKVHRLVLSACTDFFNVLETTCEVQDDSILIMPRDLQADVVVPIVNFMYTGTLEFEINMYDRLLKTAKDMNMTVLLKLLEAHKKAIPHRPPPILLNKTAGQRPVPAPTPNTGNRYGVRHVERTYSSPNTRSGKLVKPPISIIPSYLKKNVPEPVALFSKYSHVDSKTGPSRFEPPDENLPEPFDSSFNPISYESKPLITADQVSQEDQSEEEDVKPSTSMFEQLRKSGYTNPNKRPANTVLTSPPSKKPNLQDVKEYTEAHRMRKELEAEEVEDEPTEYEDVGDDLNFNEDDEEEQPLSVISTRARKSYETRNPQIKEEKSTVVIKESGHSGSGGYVKHAKIISEVLKKYPHLVKNNKNIKLKIMQKSPSQKVDSVQRAPAKSPPAPSVTVHKIPSTAPIIKTEPLEPKVQSQSAVKGGRIDSKTMHALIAKGAENMEGPWLCLRCGINGRPIGIPSYKSFRRHLINVHKEKIDPKICEHCGWRSQKRMELFHHALITHNIKPPADINFPTCSDCNFIGVDLDMLEKHIQQNHSNKKRSIVTQQCIYCNKTFANENVLYSHMRNKHKQRAREDGVLDFSDDDDDDDQYEDDADKYVPNAADQHIEQQRQAHSDGKIKILSNITLPSKSIPFVLEPGAQSVSQIGGKSAQKLEPSSEAEALSNVASGIATSLGLVDSAVVIDETQYHHGEEQILSTQYIEAAMANVHGELVKKHDDTTGMMTKLVTEDGSELELTPAQKEEIMSQLQGQNDNVVMVLNQDNFDANTQIINTDQNIVVVYSQADDGLKPTFIEATDSIIGTTSTNVSELKTVNAELTTPMEWTETEEHEQEHSQDALEHPEAEEDNKLDTSECVTTNPNEIDDDDDKDSQMNTSDDIPIVIEQADEDNEKSSDEISEKVKTEDNRTDKGQNKDKKIEEDKLKLISALEGDWTDEDETAADVHAEIPVDLAEAAADKVEQNIEVLFEISTNSLVKENKPNINEVTTDIKSEETKVELKEEVDDENLTALLGDWNDNDSQNSGKGTSGNVKQEKSENAKETVKNSSLLCEEETEKNNDEDKNIDSKVASREIKTLINDWGDDDEEI